MIFVVRKFLLKCLCMYVCICVNVYVRDKGRIGEEIAAQSMWVYHVKLLHF